MRAILAAALLAASASLVPNPTTDATIRGVASFYDDPHRSGLYAAAGPALRVGDWRGRTVRVCADACVSVQLSDWCQCYRGTDRERVIDLSSGAFARLAPLSRGLVRVRVTWGAPAVAVRPALTLPPTDVGP